MPPFGNDTSEVYPVARRSSVWFTHFLQLQELHRGGRVEEDSFEHRFKGGLEGGLDQGFYLLVPAM